MIKQRESGVAASPETTLPVSGQPAIHLRLLRQADAGEFYEVLNRGGQNLDKYQYWNNGFSLEAVEAEFARSVTQIEQGKMLRYEIINGADEAEPIIGEASMYDYDEETQTAHLGYLIIPEFERKRIVSASARTLIEYASDLWGLERVLLDIEVGNEGSEHLAASLGARATETIKQAETADKVHPARVKVRSMRIWEIPHE